MPTARSTLTLDQLLSHSSPEVLLPFVERWARSRRHDPVGLAQRGLDRLANVAPRWARALGRGLDRLMLMDRARRQQRDRAQEHLDRIAPMALRDILPGPADHIPRLLFPLSGNRHWKMQPDHEAWSRIVDTLLAHGATLDAQNAQDVSVPYELVQCGNLALLTRLPKPALAAAASVILPNGNTAVHQAARLSSPPLLAVLLAAGVDPDLPDSYGRTPLHRAVEARAMDTVQYLLDAGASVTTLNRWDESPLFLAARLLGEDTASTQDAHRYGPVHDLLVTTHVARETQALRSALDNAPSPGRQPRPDANASREPAMDSPGSAPTDLASETVPAPRRPGRARL